MGYVEDAKALIDESKSTLKEIRQEYEKSLKDQEIKAKLLIKIKNFMENLRSSLDFIAHGLYDKYGITATGRGRNIYFPYASSGMTLDEFRSKNKIDKCIPGLVTAQPSIVAAIESYQCFASAKNSWLPLFMELNNENKHQKLTPQIRKEIKELKITSGKVGIRMSGNAGIRISGNASIRIGNSIITGNQSISANSPARIQGDAKQEIITWVSFHFSTNDEPVYPLLERTLDGVEKIVNELSEM